MASRRGYAAKKAKGQHIGSIPWGYRRVDGARLEPIAPQLAVRLLAWRLYATGDYTHATLAADLNGRGHRIDYRGTDRPFTRFTVTEILRSRFDLKLGGLERDVYDRALEVAARHRINEHVGQRRHEYLFAGLARCAECGESYWGRTQVTKAGLRRRQLVHAPRGCRRGMPSEERLERIVGAWLATWRLPTDARARVARYLRRSTSDAVRDAERSRVEAELERLRKMFRWGDVGEDEYRRESSRLRARAWASSGRSASRSRRATRRYVSRRGSGSRGLWRRCRRAARSCASGWLRFSSGATGSSTSSRVLRSRPSCSRRRWSAPWAMLDSNFRRADFELNVAFTCDFALTAWRAGPKRA